MGVGDRMIVVECRVFRLVSLLKDLAMAVCSRSGLADAAESMRRCYRVNVLKGSRCPVFSMCDSSDNN